MGGWTVPREFWPQRESTHSGEETSLTSCVTSQLRHLTLPSRTPSSPCSRFPRTLLRQSSSQLTLPAEEQQGHCPSCSSTPLTSREPGLPTTTRARVASVSTTDSSTSTSRL